MSTETEKLDPPADPKTPDPKTEDKTYTSAEYKNLASEKKLAEDKARTLQVEVDKLNAEKTKATEDDLKKKGDLQTIIDTKEKEISELKARADKADELQKKLEDIETATRAELLEGLTDEQKEDCKDMSLKDIRTFAKHIKKVESIETDGGGKKGHKEVKLSEAEKKEAAKMGLSDEDYKEVMEYRDTISKNKKEGVKA